MPFRTLLGAFALASTLTLPASPAQLVGGQALRLSAPGDEVLVLPSASLNLPGEFTIEAWGLADVPSTASTSCAIFSRSTVSTIGYIFGCQYQGTLQMASGSTGLSVMPPTPGIWHHLAWVHGTAQDKIYVDGCLVGQFQSIAHVTTASGVVAHIGSEPFGLTEFWTGKIDELRIWGVARTQAQIRSTINATISVPMPGLISAWNFEGTALDAVGTNHGALAGNAGFAAANRPALAFGGQANTAAASLWVNGQGGSACGPFALALVPNSTLSFVWAGPPQATLVLLLGPQNPGNSFFGCVGFADVGTPPAFADLTVLFDGAIPAFPNFLFQLDATGAAQQTFTIGALPPGLQIGLQGAVRQLSGPCPAILTAAFYLNT